MSKFNSHEEFSAALEEFKVQQTEMNRQAREAFPDDEQREKVFDTLHSVLIHFESLEDFDLIVLKGHLLVEQLLQKLVADKVLKPKELDTLRFSQLLVFAKAMYVLPEDVEWVWEAMKRLNTLRNTVAHELDGGDALDKRVKAFISSVEPGQIKQDGYVHSEIKNLITAVSWIYSTHNM